MAKPYMQTMNVTPEMAEQWLDNADRNRRLNQGSIARMARDMASGKFDLTHQGIALSTSGKLIDGQHRLRAVIRSGVSVRMHVWFDISPKSMMHIDTGKTRTAHDSLTIAGISVVKDEIAVLRMMLNPLGGVNGDYMGRTILTNDEITMELSYHSGVIRKAIAALPKIRNTKGISTSVTWACMARAYWHEDDELINAFGGILHSGMVDNPATQSSAITVRNYLIQRIGTGGGGGERGERYLKIQRGLRAFINGESLLRLYADSDLVWPLPTWNDQG